MGLISGIISIALGAWAIGNPDRSVLLFVTIIGIWCIFKGAPTSSARSRSAA